MSGSIILGIIFIFIGISFIAKVFFKIDFPVFKILVALFFLYLGFKILFGSFGVSNFRNDGHNAVFSETRVKGNVTDGAEYNAVFGKVMVDLRNVELTEPETEIEINAVFGGAEVLIDPDMPIKIKSDVAFGGIDFPDGKSGGFGSSGYTSPKYDKESKVLYLRLNAVFGGIKVREARR